MAGRCHWVPAEVESATVSDHVTPEGARRHANALNVLGTHPHLESARQLRSLAAQVEEYQQPNHRWISEREWSATLKAKARAEAQVEEMREREKPLVVELDRLQDALRESQAQVEQMQAVVEAARYLAVYPEGAVGFQDLSEALAALDEKEN